MYVYPRISRDDPGTSVVSQESWDTQTYGVGGITTCMCTHAYPGMILEPPLYPGNPGILRHMGLEM